VKCLFLQIVQCIYTRCSTLDEHHSNQRALLLQFHPSIILQRFSTFKSLSIFSFLNSILFKPLQFKLPLHFKMVSVKISALPLLVLALSKVSTAQSYDSYDLAARDAFPEADFDDVAIFARDAEAEAEADFEELDARGLDDFDLVARELNSYLEARDARGGRPSSNRFRPSGNSILNFAGNAVAAGGQVGAALINSQQQQAPPQKRGLEYLTYLEARDALPRGGRPASGRSHTSGTAKLDFAGNVVTAAGDIGSALIANRQRRAIAILNHLEARDAAVARGGRGGGRRGPSADAMLNFGGNVVGAAGQIGGAIIANQGKQRRSAGEFENFEY
jgi:hypothetical protein